ncbi:MAG: biotin carboxylase N-terminal domain-containing protein [Pseudomonadales bacterium]
MADVSFRPITRLLIANRGEIARRIMRTAREMGIGTVAVYADSDAHAPFVKEADVAIALGGRTSRETYLDSNKILDACRRTGADAVHPGYGFLSENTEFAQAVTAAGMIWVGPPPAAIAAMGDKLSAKRLMQEAAVPTLPAVELAAGESLASAAEQVGYPLLVKASAGGGGRGMRVVERAEDLQAAVEGARREAGSAFGDDTLFMERWLPACRHVEIQILGDLHGNLVHCFERECSIQRRHQKVIEEAPSPVLTDDLRARMGDAAVAAGRTIGYASAGTVEFLVDGDDFWFLEVNTRLQVEHPVTEAITGLDLVREQIRIAEGEPLGYDQSALTITGHAIEARLYAEDPANRFLPSPGKVSVWEPPATPRARFDSGIETGTEVGTEFDPMLAKVIVHAPTRHEAAARLAKVLAGTRIQGLTTNRDFLVATLRTPEFLRGDTTTDFIERVNPEPRRRIETEELHEGMIAVIIESQARRRAAAKVLKSLASGWRNSFMPPQRVAFVQGEETLMVYYARGRDGIFTVSFAETQGDIRYPVRVYAAGGGEVDMEVAGRRINARLTAAGLRWFVHTARGDLTLDEAPRFTLPGAGEFTGGLTAPMPGKVLSAAVKAGDQVRKGELLLILEAMKMEHRINSPVDGTVLEVQVGEGEQVANGQLLVIVEEAG